MNLSRIVTLREILDEGCLEKEEVAEIEDAYNEIHPESAHETESVGLRNMLGELEDRVSNMEKILYEYVSENYGESEANDPSWSLGPLADALNSRKLKVGMKTVTLGELLDGE